MANRLFTFHGAGGGAGACNFGSGANHPSASWYTTHQLSGGDWFGWSASNIINQLLLPQIQTGDNVILHGFSAGGYAVQNVLASGTTLNGTLRGVIIDDPAYNPVTFGNRGAGVRAALWAARYSNGVWVVETLNGGGGAGAISGLASRLGVTAQVNPYFQTHAPMSSNCNLGGGPSAGPPELAQTSAWWTASTGGGTTNPPPTTGNKIRVVCSMHGGNGGSGAGGYGSNGDHPRGDFVTVAGTDQGTNWVIDGTFVSASGKYSPAMNFGWTYKSFGRDAMLAYWTAGVNEAIRMKGATDAEVIFCGFSYGGGAVCHLADYGWDMGGRVIGYIIDDPGGYPLDCCCAQGCKDPDQPYNNYDPTRKRKLYYAPGGATESYTTAMATLLGITRTPSIFGTAHLPYTSSGQPYPEMQVGTSTSWWGTVTTTPPPPTQLTKVVVGLAGLGGYVGDPNNGFGGPGYPRGAHFRTGMAQGNQTYGSGTPQGYQWNLASYATGLANVQSAAGNNSNDEIILHGFSDGAKFLIEMINRGETLNGRVKGFILDDPNVHPGPFTNPAGSRIKLYAVQRTDLQWESNVIAGYDYLTALETAYGITRVKNTRRTTHGPYIVDSQSVFWTPEEGTVTGQMWWGLNAPEPPPVTSGDWTTYQSESATYLNAISGGIKDASINPGFTGTGYTADWWQTGEGVRFSSVNGGATQATRTIRFHYRNADVNFTVTRRLVVNGVTIRTLTFSRNANAWTENAWADLDTTVTLNAGSGNTIDLINDSQGGLDLDYMAVNVATDTTPPPPPGSSGLAPTVMQGENIFPADFFAYADVRNLNVLPDSQARLNTNMSDPTFRPEWGTAWYHNKIFPWFLSTSNSTGTEGYPLRIVEANGPTVPLTQFKYSWSANESNVALGEQIPVPLDTRREGVAGDTHWVVLQKGTHYLYEAWDTDVFNGGWSVGVIIKWDLTKYAARPDGFTSSNGAGFPFLPLAYHYDEVNEDRINHATFMCASYLSAQYIWPASHLMNPGDGVSQRVRAGEWIRIKANVDLSSRGLGTFALRIANALKKHGAIIGDIGPLWQINGLWDTRWPNADLMTLQGITGNDFELVDASPLRKNTQDRTLFYQITQNTGGTTQPPPTVGDPIEVPGRTNTVLVDLSTAAARTAAATNLLNDVQQGGWDGIYLTDAIAEVSLDSSQSTKADTNAEVQALTQSALSEIGTTLRNAGFIVVAEADDIADYASLSNTWEALLTGVADPEFLRDWTNTAKSDAVQAQQGTNVAHDSASTVNPWTRFNVHHTLYQNEANSLFALATYLAFTEGVSMLGLSSDSGRNDPPPNLPAEFFWDLGNQTAARTTPFTNVYMRKFERGVVVANLSGTSQTVSLGGTYYNKTSTTGMTSVVVAADSGVVLRTTPPEGGTPTPPPTSYGTGVKAFEDTFDSTLNTTTWKREYSWGAHSTCTGGNAEGYNVADRVTASGGNLAITALKSNVTGYDCADGQMDHVYPWRAGVATTQNSFRFRYGVVEARWRWNVPFTNSQGLWPAIWLYGDHDTDEIDVMEMPNLAANQIFVNHHKTGSGSGTPTAVNNVTQGEWHLSVCEWEPNRIRWWVDGVLVADRAIAITTDQWLIINEAVGGPWPNPTNASTQSGGTAHLEVDYIRVWRTVNTTVTDLSVGGGGGTGTGKWEIDSNGHFISPEGNRTRFMGANMSYHGAIGPLNNRVSGTSTYPNGADIAQWGWNMVRLISWSSFGNVSSMVQQTIQIHNDLAARKIVLMVADWSLGVGTWPTFSTSNPQYPYFSQVIDAIGDSPYFWINYANEPQGYPTHPSTSFVNFWNSAYNFVRSRPKGANTMFVVDAGNGGQAGAECVSTGDWAAFANGKHHVVLSFHAYMAGKNATQLEADRTLLNNAKVPWMVGEYAWSATRPNFTCCGGTYTDQRAGGLKIINEWYPAGESHLWWMANADYDPNPEAGYVYSLRTVSPGSGTGYSDWNVPLNEAGQAMWNQRSLSKTW